MIESKKVSKNRIEMKISHVLYYIFLIIMFFVKGIGLYDGQVLYRILFLAAMLCAAGKIFLTGYTKKEWFWIILLGMFAVIVERNSGEKGVLICYAIVAGMKEIPVKRVMQIGACIYTITLLGMVTYFGVFLEQSAYIEEIRIGLGSTVRYGLGYSHPNTLMVTYLATITLIIICLGEKYNWKYSIFLSAGMLYIYWYCMSYTALITCTLVIVLPLYLMKIRKGKLGIIEYIIGGVSLPLSLGYSFLAPFLMPERLLLFFQQHLSTFYSRLKLAKMYVIPSYISLLGTHVTKVTDSKYTLDNSFLYTFIFNGVLFFCIMMLLYFYMMYRLIKEKRNLELIITCVFFVQAIMEPYMFNTSFKNITLFFLGELIWDKAEAVEGRFDSIKLVLPNSLIKYKNLFMECWKQNMQKILLASGVMGAIVFLVCFAGSMVLNSTAAMTMVSWRGNIAIAWLASIVMAFIVFGMKIRTYDRR